MRAGTARYKQTTTISPQRLYLSRGLFEQWGLSLALTGQKCGGRKMPQEQRLANKSAVDKALRGGGLGVMPTAGPGRINVPSADSVL